MKTARRRRSASLPVHFATNLSCGTARSAERCLRMRTSNEACLTVSEGEHLAQSIMCGRPVECKTLYRWDRSGSVMCPAFYRGIVATGPDEVRGWRANQFVELKALGEPRLCSIPGPTGSPSLLSPSFLRSTIAEPDSFKRLRAGKSPLFSEEPTRRGRSCWRSLPTPCVPVCAARASRSTGMMEHQCALVV